MKIILYSYYVVLFCC